MQSIPTKWKELLKQEEEIIYVNPLEKYGKGQSITRNAYRLFNSNPNLLAPIVQKWEKEVGENELLTQNGMIKAMSDVYKITNYTKYRSFQYRFLCKAIVLNPNLMRYGIRDNDRCSFCDIYKESVEHLFYDCQVTNYFLDEIKRKLNIDIKSIPLEMVIVNKINENPKRVENLILLSCKFYIYRQRCMSKKPNFNEFKQMIQNIKEIEETIAKSKNKLPLHTSNGRILKYKKEN